MPDLALDSLTLTENTPAALIKSGAAAGFDLVSLWVQPPPMYASMLLTPVMEAECAALLADTGVRVHSLEALDLVSEEAIEATRPALEMGARLGGKVVVAMHLSNPDRGHAADLLALLAQVAAEYGLGVNLEPIAMGATATLAQARDLIHASGADAGILFDTWHLVRSGGSVADLQAIEPGLIRYVQVCDGPPACPPERLVEEALQERLYPGYGTFPLAELLRAAPRDVPWAVETPSLRRVGEGVTAKDQARETMAALRKVMAESD